MDQEEKRRYPRVEFREPLHYQERGAAESDNCLAKDISAGGIGFISQTFIAPQTNLMLELRVLSRLISTAARVTWASASPGPCGYNLGAEFIDPGPQEKQFLKDYVDMCRGVFLAR